MKTGDKVQTPHGKGEVLTQEYAEGALSERYLVKLEDCPHILSVMHFEQGGLYYWRKDMEVIECSLKQN